MTTQQHLHSYIEYQKYLIDEMLYNTPIRKGVKLQNGFLKKWNASMFADIVKLEREIKRLQDKYQYEQINDSKTFYLMSLKGKKNNDAMIRDEIKAPEGFKSDNKKYQADYYKNVRKLKLTKNK